MAVFSFLFILLFGGAAVVVLIGIALAMGRYGIAASIAGLVFLCMVAGAVGLFFMAVSAPRRVVVSQKHVAVNSGLSNLPNLPQISVDGVPQFHSVSVQGPLPTWRISIRPVLVILCGVFIGLMIISVRRSSLCTAAGRGRYWPAFVVLPILGLVLLIGGIRYQRAPQVVRIAPPVPPKPFGSAVQKQNQELAKQQQALAQITTRLDAEMKRRIDHTDIHQLMDEFDTPQIMLQAQLAPTASPAALILAATPSALAPAVKPAAEAKAAATFQPAVKTGHDTVHAVAPKLTPQKQQPPGATAAVVKESQKTNAAPPAATASSDRALAHVSNGPPAPEWVHNPPKRVGDVQREVLVTDEWSSEEECERARNIGLMLNIYEHIQRLSGAPYRGYPQDQRMNAENAFLSDHRLHTLASAGITVDYALREIAKDEYVETSERSIRSDEENVHAGGVYPQRRSGASSALVCLRATRSICDSRRRNWLSAEPARAGLRTSENRHVD